MLQGMSEQHRPGSGELVGCDRRSAQGDLPAGDPSSRMLRRRAVAEAVRLADLWLDPATEFPSTGAGARAGAGRVAQATMPAWKEVISRRGAGAVLDGLDDAQH